MKKLISILMACLMISCLFACGKKASNEQASNNAVTNTAVTNSASANIPAEYKQVTTNENGVKIYGKIVDANTASDTGKQVISKNAGNDKSLAKKGFYYTYSEYASEAYGGTVIIRTNNTSGGREVYDANGECFMSGDAKSKNYDLENSLAKYRLGNAMAEAIDRKVNGN